MKFAQTSSDDESAGRRRSRSRSSSESSDSDRSPTVEEQFQNLEEEGRNSVRLGTPHSRLIVTRQQSQRLGQDSLDQSFQEALQLTPRSCGSSARNSAGQMLVAANACTMTGIVQDPPVEEARDDLIGEQDLGIVVPDDELLVDDTRHTSPIALIIMLILVKLAIYNWLVSRK